MTECTKGPLTAIFTGPMCYGKSQLVLDLIERNTTSILTASSLSAQRIDGIRHIVIKVE